MNASLPAPAPMLTVHWRRSLSGILLRLLGVLLLMAAALKMHGLGIEPVRPTGWFALAGVQFAIVLVEVLLGVWFLSGLHRSAAWLAAFALFSVFAIVSFRQGWIGESSCGCFGAVKVSPWIAFTIDLTVLMLLGLTRPARDDTAGVANIAHWLAPVACGVTLLAGLFVGISALAFGSPAAALAFLRGERISVQPAIVDVGNGRAGEIKEVQVTIRNWTDKPIQVFGGTQDCSCTVLGDLPLTIPAGESSALAVGIRLSARPGVFTRKANLAIDEGGFKRVHFRLTGRVLEREVSTAQVTGQ